MATTKLKAVRGTLGYKAEAVIAMLTTRAGERGIPVMSPSSLKTKLSEWENGRSNVSEQYRVLFREIYGRTNEELGFPPEHEDDEASELRSRLAIARTVDAGTVEAFRRQVDAARHPDRKFGGMRILDELRSTITQMQELLDFSTTRGQRAALAAALTEASTLAGRLALDRNAVGQAWNHYERAKTAARESGSPGLLAHATAEQAFVLIDIGETTAAVDQLNHARDLATDKTSPLLGAWLAAAHGEGLGAAGEAPAALRAFDHADELLPADPQDPELPFVFLGDSHLDRWRGNVMVRVGDPTAIGQLTDALDRLPPTFVRAELGMLVDLAFAYAAAGDRPAAQHHARQERQLGQQIKSDRQLNRVRSLKLPS